MEEQLQSFSKFVLAACEWTAIYTGCFTAGERTPMPIECEAEKSSGRVWTVLRSRESNYDISVTEPVAHSLYRLSYAGFTLHEIKKKILFSFSFSLSLILFFLVLVLFVLSSSPSCYSLSFPFLFLFVFFSIFLPHLYISCVNHSSSSPRPFLFLSFIFSYSPLFSVKSFSLFFLSLSFL